ncbi:hypothetical protein GCM10023340_08330 [Nocardioides marinquilinus]|uniref:DUF222 domain-containing protein n=1 Tax=Nocardioides marinquilinus TaxID=1210400 RepID=A0ABP9PA80_9ACTN
MNAGRPTITDILGRVEADASLATVEQKARGVLAACPPAVYPAVIVRLAAMLIEVRARRGRLVQQPAAAQTPRPVDPPDRPHDLRPPDPVADQPPRTPVRPPTSRPAPSGHASPRIRAATLAWRDLLTTRLTMHGVAGPYEVEVQHMSPIELRNLADTMHDTTERLHALADTLEQHGVRSAADLEPAQIAAIGGGQ